MMKEYDTSKIEKEIWAEVNEELKNKALKSWKTLSRKTNSILAFWVPNELYKYCLPHVQGVFDFF